MGGVEHFRVCGVKCSANACAQVSPRRSWVPCWGGWRCEAAPGLGGLTSAPAAGPHTAGVLNEARLGQGQERRARARGAGMTQWWVGASLSPLFHTGKIWNPHAPNRWVPFLNQENENPPTGPPSSLTLGVLIRILHASSPPRCSAWLGLCVCPAHPLPPGSLGNPLLPYPSPLHSAVFPSRVPIACAQRSPVTCSLILPSLVLWSPAPGILPLSSLPCPCANLWHCHSPPELACLHEAPSPDCLQRAFPTR